jgi:DNA repair exonuclease SbcCD ATPase subunit
MDRTEGYRLMNTKIDDMAKAQANGFEAIAAAIQNHNGCGAIDALRRARAEYPREFEAYEAAGPSMIAKAAETSQRERDEAATAKSKIAAWNAKITELRGEKGSFTEATAQAKKAFPDLFRQAFGE